MWSDKTDAERVAAGAALLDERNPGWAERIDTDRLTFVGASGIEDCILGQLYGYTHDGVIALGLPISERQPGNWYELGFNGNVHRLAKLWAAEVNQRIAVPTI